MWKLKRLMVTIAAGLISLNCYAKQISFQVVQHDSSAESVTEQSLTIEDEVLNKFFEYGFIVTNSSAEIAKSDNADEKLFKSGIGEAFNGYSDYFVQINLFYTRNENTTSKNADLKKIDFSIANAKTGVTFVENTLENIKLNNKKDDLKKISLNLADEINKALKANRDKA